MSKRRVYPPRRCEWCGRNFVPRDARSRCCSPKCSAEYTKRYDREYRRTHKKARFHKLDGLGKALHPRVVVYADPVSEEVLFRARKKPSGTSDVRWRIELSRRRLAAAGLVDMLPDPDRLA